jgi:hypothetical protein
MTEGPVHAHRPLAISSGPLAGPFDATGSRAGLYRGGEPA